VLRILLHQDIKGGVLIKMSSTGKDEQVRKIFVGGLDYDTVEATIEQYFGQWGPVSECTVKRFPDGKSRGFGFVTFSSLAAMENCFENQPHTIDGKRVDLRKAAETGHNRGADTGSKGYDPEARELKKLFVGSLEFSTTEDEVNEYFSKYGDIVSVSISKFPDSGKSRGFAFVTFQSAKTVDQVQQSRPHVIKGRKLETKRATPKHLVGKPESQVSTTKIFIGPPEVRSKGHSGLTEEISDEDLTEYFGQFGTLVKVQQMRWEDSGKKRGYGYVEFTDEDAVDKAVLVRTHIIKDREIESKKALTRQQMNDIEEMKNKSGGLQNMSMNNMGMGNNGMAGMNNMGMGMNNMGMGGNAMGMNNMGMGDNAMGMNMGMMGNNSMGMGNMGSGNYNRGVYNTGTGMRANNNSSEPRGTKRPRTAVDLESKIMRKLYVGNLDFGTSEDDLKAHFEQYGDVEDVNILKHQDSGRSKGFAFISFVNSSGVDNVQMCRPHLLQGKTLDTKRALPKGDNNSQDDVRVKKIFIGGPQDEKHLGGHTGLSDDIQDDDLNNYFSQYGVVVKIDQLRWNDSGKKRGYGYIEFDDEDSVDKVCLIGIHEVLGVRLEVKKAVEKNSGQRSNVSSYVSKEGDNRGAKRSRKEQIDPESKVMRKIFIGNLNLSTTEEKLKEYFEQFGSTELVQLPLHMDSGKSRGFAFITYEKASYVDACQAARPHKLDGSFIETTRATPKHDLGNPEAEAKVKKIYIGGANDERVSGHCGLTEDISDEDLEDYFGQFGIVTKVDQKIWEDTQKKRGYGYIEFDDEDTVDKIVLLGVHVVKGVRLEAKKGLNKDQLQKKAMGGMNTGSRMGSVGTVGMGGNNMGGGMQNNMKGGFMNNQGGNSMGNMMGQMQSMMGSMSSGNMNKSNMMGNMEQMQKMMGNMQNNMGTGGMGSEKNMQMMQNMMNMQNMMGNMQNTSGSNSDQNMAMMASMQQMMMNMMSMCTQMMSQGMNNSQTSGNNNPAPKSAGSTYCNTSQGNVSGQSNTSSGYSSQSSSSYGTQGMSNYTTGYGSSASRFTSPPPSTSRYNTGMGNTGSYTGMGGNSSSTGMGQGYSGSGMMGQQGNSAYSGMGNTSRGGGGPVRGGMAANRGNPYSRN